MSKKFLDSLYINSLTIRERYEQLDNIEILKNKESINNHLKHWETIVGPSSTIYLKKRLEWSEIKYSDIPKLLSKNIKLKKAHKYPRWLIELSKFIESNVEFEEPLDDSDIPFSEVFIPIVKYFFNFIESKEFLSKDAYDDLRDVLLKEFSKLGSQSILEYKLNNEFNRNELLEFLLDSNYRDFFLEYSYLARLLFQRGIFWYENVNNMFEHISKNKKILISKLDIEEIKIVSIEASTSDSHNFGKSVIILKNENEKKFIYKPRSLSSEKTFFNFIKFFNSKSKLYHYVPWIIEGENYGFMEFIYHYECKSEHQVKEFYRRIGSYIYIFNILGATDMHSENLIANGEFPVFIDLETLFTPLLRLNSPHLNKLNEQIDLKFGISVTRSGILPNWLLGPDTQVHNNSALGGNMGGIKYPKIVWADINDESISFKYKNSNFSEDDNILYLNSNIVDPSDYINEIIEGFNHSHKVVSDVTYIKEFDKIIEKFANVQIRFVFRATKVYTLLLDFLNHPDYMKNGITRSLEYEILSKGLLLNTNKKYKFWKIFEDEIMHLENNDIPYYCITPIGNTISSYYKENIYKDPFRYIPYKKFKHHMKNMDLDFQIEMIKKTITTNKIDKKTVLASTHHKISEKNINKDKVVSSIDSITTLLLNNSLNLDNRSTWVSYVSNVVSHTYGYKPIGLDMSNGNMGVAVFLSAMYKFTSNASLRSATLYAINPILDILNYEWSKRDFISKFGTGGTTGLGSLVYGLAIIGENLKSKEIINYACEFAKLINNEVINKNLRSDVVSGNAGLLLALIKLYRINNAVFLLPIIDSVVSDIYNKGLVENVFVNWPYQEDKYLLGFSHGSSGILYALSKYIAHIKYDEKIVGLVDSILMWEEKEYNSNLNNWPDYRYEKVDYSVVSWCHGALGIGMSRFELYKIDEFKDISKRVIRNSFRKVIEDPFHHLDTLCCGNAGRLDYYLEIPKYFKDNENRYIIILTNDLCYRLQNKTLNLFSNFETEDYNFGLYQGISGIGYQLLRVLEPKEFRSILLFE